jgi:N-acylglucosamine-6-phosphate 2-epimerase
VSGYTAYSRHLAGPDLQLISELVQAVHVPVFAEGRYRRTEDVEDAFARGAYGVVIGAAISNPIEITRLFVGAFSRSIGSHPSQRT